MTDYKSIKDIERRFFEYDGGYKITSITSNSGGKMNFSINKTMLRIDLDKPLSSGSSVTFNVKWWYNINDRSKVGGRSGYEYFPDEDNYLSLIHI